MIEDGKLLTFIRSKQFSPMSAGELGKRLSLGKDDMGELPELLEDLERRGELVNVKKKQWVQPDRAGLLVGRLQCNPRGFGFVIPVRDDLDRDVYVAEEDMGPAMHGDLVVVEVRQQRPGRGARHRKDLGPSGRIIKIVERRNQLLIGTFVPGRKSAWVVPDNPGLFRDIYVAGDDTLGAKEGDQVLVEITVPPSLHRSPQGEVREVLGTAGDPELDVRTVMLEFGLPTGFPDEVAAAAARLPRRPPGEEVRGRSDLRGYTTVTVDPEDAKDYDDALSFRRDRRTGRRVVLVHIADISHYVAPDSVLDLEARQRGCSVYLANDVVPMFPPAESKGVLSLNEGEDRLAKTVTLRFDDQGKVTSSKVARSVIRVDRRLTYREVQEALEALDSDDPAVQAALEKLPEDVGDVLRDLDELAQQVRALRQQTGSIDLDVPDYDVRVDEDGRVVSVTQIVRDRSHALVEEFMLAANRAIAALTSGRKLPALYRVHDEPPDEDLVEFGTFVRTVLGRGIDALDRRALQALLAEVAGTHLSEAVNMQLLRAMTKAQYSPSCRPHFALHFDRYCHFTSPIRRYPDLVVHQVLDQMLRDGGDAGGLRSLWRRKLPRIAAHCNEMQDRADEAEREIVKIKLLRYLEDHKGEAFDGVITGVMEIGIFVRLEEFSVEGLVKVQDIRDDFYRFQGDAQALVGTRTGRTFMLGQPVKVVVSEIDMLRRRLDLQLFEEPGQERRPGRPRATGRAPRGGSQRRGRRSGGRRGKGTSGTGEPGTRA
jgi:ribonuclease R